MCTEVYVGYDKPEISTPRELAVYLGVPVDSLPAEGGRDTIADAMANMAPGGPDWRDCCLCNVDIISAILAKGFWLRRDETGAFNTRRPDEIKP